MAINCAVLAARICGRLSDAAGGADGTLRQGPTIATGDGRRLNDGKPDPAGRFVVGTLVEPGPSHEERLVRVENDGRITVLDADLTLSNGLAWSADGRQMFSVDTLSQRIFVRDYDPETGVTGPRRTFAVVDVGLPDGMAIDREGCLWVAAWGGGHVLRLDPDGRLCGAIPVPAPHVSCVAFTGPDLATLVITTARQGLTPPNSPNTPSPGGCSLPTRA